MRGKAADGDVGERRIDRLSLEIKWETKRD
ncbi:hypothetical protein L195_g051313, partial [Trifolium pratense]